MEHHKDQEATPYVKGSWWFLAAFVVGLAGGVGIAAAAARDPSYVAWQGAGYTVIVYAGLCLVVSGGLRLIDAILKRDDRHHEQVMAELDGIRAMLAPASDIDRRRSSR